MLNEKDGVTMVWHYNAFLSYEAEPVEEERVWLDPETANLKQVDLNAYVMTIRGKKEDPVVGRIKSAEFRYAAALAFMNEEEEKAVSLDRRG